jgi:general stress protein YciG
VANFSTMDPAVVSEIARKGGKAVHAAGKAYRFTKEKAREAGRKGGLALAAKRRAKGEKP